MKLVYQCIAIFFNFYTTSNHLHPIQVENCDSNSRLVVNEDDNGKFRPERVNDAPQFLRISFPHLSNLSHAIYKTSFSWDHVKHPQLGGIPWECESMYRPMPIRNCAIDLWWVTMVAKLYCIRRSMAFFHIPGKHALQVSVAKQIPANENKSVVSSEVSEIVITPPFLYQVNIWCNLWDLYSAHKLLW